MRMFIIVGLTPLFDYHLRFSYAEQHIRVQTWALRYVVTTFLGTSRNRL